MVNNLKLDFAYRNVYYPRKSNKLDNLCQAVMKMYCLRDDCKLTKENQQLEINPLALIRN